MNTGVFIVYVLPIIIIIISLIIYRKCIEREEGEFPTRFHCLTFIGGSFIPVVGLFLACALVTALCMNDDWKENKFTNWFNN